LHRPSSRSWEGNYIWIADLPICCIGAIINVWLDTPGNVDSARLGSGAAPIKTEKGWLEIYHGANEDNRYCLGALLLDLRDLQW